MRAKGRNVRAMMLDASTDDFRVKMARIERDFMPFWYLTYCGRCGWHDGKPREPCPVDIVRREKDEEIERVIRDRDAFMERLTAWRTEKGYIASDVAAFSLADEIRSRAELLNAVRFSTEPPRAATVLSNIEKSVKRIRDLVASAEKNPGKKEAGALWRWIARSGNENRRDAVKRFLADAAEAYLAVQNANKNDVWEKSDQQGNYPWTKDFIATDLVEVYYLISGQTVAVGTDATGVNFIESDGINFIRQCMEALRAKVTVNTVATYIRERRAEAIR